MHVLDTDLDQDLAPFSAFLWQQGVAHRIFEDGGRQVLSVDNPANADEVKRAFDDWRAGRFGLELTPTARKPSRWNLAQLMLAYPIVSSVVLACCLLFPISMGWLASGSGAMQQLLFWPQQAPAVAPGDIGGLVSIFAAQPEFWRLLTPALLHFSIMHIAFNLAIFVFVGRRIEYLLGHGSLVVVVVVTALLSNVAQALWHPDSTFGGLSGVCYGVVAYGWLAARRQGLALWQLPPGLMPALLIMLLLFSTGITEPLGLFVANAAHWGGLVSGLLLASVYLPGPRHG
ncbi:MAG: rhomboid family intramembrane serine protease [Pseudomonadaceae bacterium]|nr:rhomboid family intramembrane serine protease [Pseudomonadaceae bacterium]